MVERFDYNPNPIILGSGHLDSQSPAGESEEGVGIHDQITIVLPGSSRKRIRSPPNSPNMSPSGVHDLKCIKEAGGIKCATRTN